MSRNARGINTMVLEKNNTGFYGGIAKNNTNETINWKIEAGY